MFRRNDDLRITQVRPLLPPAILLEELPVTERASNVVANSRQAIADVVSGRDSRLVVIVGPCSIHDTGAALEYAERLLPLAQRYKDQLITVMRCYFEKPRTSVGWKGLVNDPDLDESYHINKGLRLARQLLLDVNDLGLPAACEFLDTQLPQHIADLTSWVAIGARTTESYDAASVRELCDRLRGNGLPERVMIDCSHGNSQKDHRRQADVAADISAQVANGEHAIVGVMIESHLVEGRQTYVPGRPAVYGQSITDACLSLAQTEPLLEQFAKAQQTRGVATAATT